MTGPPTGAVNGVLSKGTSTASDLKGPLAGKQLLDLVNLIEPTPHKIQEVRFGDI